MLVRFVIGLLVSGAFACCSMAMIPNVVPLFKEGAPFDLYVVFTCLFLAFYLIVMFVGLFHLTTAGLQIFAKARSLRFQHRMLAPRLRPH